MLKIVIPGNEMYDEVKNEFFVTKTVELQLEHSLVSLSKWEAKWRVPFISTKNKTVEQTLDYIQMMVITQNVPPDTFRFINQDVVDKVRAYIDEPMTATTFSIDKSKTTNREVITAEVIYYWMVAFNIPFECQKWHLNRLLTLINVCSIKNQPAKKLSPKELRQQRNALNAQRKAKLNTTG